MRNIHFVIREKEKAFELWVNGECITDCFSLKGDEADLMAQLVEFAYIPCFKELDDEEIQKIVKEV